MDLQGAGMDMKTLIHVGVELVVMAGMAFWMNKRIGSVEAGVQACMAQMKKYEEIIAQQSNVISRHDAMLRQIFGGAPPPPGPPPGLPLGPGPTGPTPEPRVVMATQQSSESGPGSIPPPAPGKMKQEVRSKPEKVLKEVTPDDLDKILQDELNKERSGSSTPEIEVDTKISRRRLKSKKKE